MRRLLALLLLLGWSVWACAQDCPNVTNAPAAPQLAWTAPAPEAGVETRGYQVLQRTNDGPWTPVASLQGTTLTLPLLPRGRYVWDLLVLRQQPDGTPLPPVHATPAPNQRPPCAVLLDVTRDVTPLPLRRTP